MKIRPYSILNFSWPIFIYLALMSSWSSVNAQMSPYPDNEARNAILKERQRIDVLRADFDKLRGDAQTFRTEAEAIRRESEVLRVDVNGVKTNLDLMFRKVDAKIDDGLKPSSDSVQRSVGELEILKNAQQDLLNQLEDARKEVRQLRGQIEEMQNRNSRNTSPGSADVLKQIIDLQRSFEERLNSLAITRK